MEWADRVAVDPEICHGPACIRGTRVPVTVILDNLAEGETPESIATGYHITPGDVQAALQYGADLARERIILVRG